MEPARELRAVGGVDGAVDQVSRAREFIRRHPEVSVTWPRQNGTNLFIASWFSGQPEEGIVSREAHENLAALLDYLESRFDRGDLMPEKPL